jgi:hypothetical protein
MMRLTADPYAFDPAGQQAMLEALQSARRMMERSIERNGDFRTPYVDWNLVW